MEFKVDNVEVYGLDKACIASGNAMRTSMQDNAQEAKEQDLNRSIRLGTTGLGEGHDNFLNGIVVQFDLYAPLYMWKQIQRYHFLDFISSQSTMHKLVKFDIKSQCVADVDDSILRRYQCMLDFYNVNLAKFSSEEREMRWRQLVASLPSGFVLGATMTTNYRQLKTIYYQRRYHKLREWREFCEWCLTLPMFKDLCVAEVSNEA